jgi:hypothetical protein
MSVAKAGSRHVPSDAGHAALHGRGGVRPDRIIQDLQAGTSLAAR